MGLKGGWYLLFGDVKASVTVRDPQQCRIRTALDLPTEEWITDRVQGVEFEGSLDCWNTALVASPWRPSK